MRLVLKDLGLTYTEWAKKLQTVLIAITLSTVNQFS